MGALKWNALYAAPLCGKSHWLYKVLISDDSNPAVWPIRQVKPFNVLDQKFQYVLDTDDVLASYALQAHGLILYSDVWNFLQSEIHSGRRATIVQRFLDLLQTKFENDLLIVTNMFTLNLNYKVKVSITKDEMLARYNSRIVEDKKEHFIANNKSRLTEERWFKEWKPLPECDVVLEKGQFLSDFLLENKKGGSHYGDD